MQSKRDGLIPVADVLSDLNGPVAASELKKIKIAFIRLTGRAPGQQPFEILEDLVGYVSCEAKGLAYKFARFWALP